MYYAYVNVIKVYFKIRRCHIQQDEQKYADIVITAF